MSQQVTIALSRDYERYTPTSISGAKNDLYMNASLNGLRVMFQRVLEFKTPIEIVFTERIKELFQKRAKNKLEYPYGFCVITDMELPHDRKNIADIARTGQITQRSTNQGIEGVYAFPCNISFNLVILDSDAKRMMLLSQAILLGDAGRAFNFNAEIDGKISQIKIERTGSISTNEPMIDTSNESDAYAGRIQVPFIMKCNLGFNFIKAKFKAVRFRAHANYPNPLEDIVFEEIILTDDDLIAEVEGVTDVKL